jgi:hypothetical protein
MIRPLEHITDAPCYWEVADDGADWQCKSCDLRGPAGEMLGILTPNGTFQICHKDCTDPDWLKRAKKMSGKI